MPHGEEAGVQIEASPFAVAVFYQSGEGGFRSGRVGVDRGVLLRVVDREVRQRHAPEPLRTFAEGDQRIASPADRKQFAVCREVGDRFGVVPAVIDAEDVGKLEIPGTFAGSGVERTLAGGDQRAAFRDEIPQCFALLRRQVGGVVDDDGGEPGKLARPSGEHAVRKVEPIEQFRRSEHFVKHGVVTDRHIVGAVGDGVEPLPVPGLVDAACHREIETDLRLQSRAVFRDFLPVRFETRGNGSETGIELFGEGAVRIDRIDEEIGAAVGQRGGGVEKEFVIRLGRRVVVQRHAARSHELVGPVPGEGGERLDSEALLEPAAVEVARGVVRGGGDSVALPEEPAVEHRRKLVGDREFRIHRPHMV